MDVRLFLDQIKDENNLKTDADLAEFLDVTKSALNSWLQRKKIPAEILVKLNGEDFSPKIPLLSHPASAGHGVEILREHIAGHIDLPTALFKTAPSVAQIRSFIAVMVQGDSMSPTFTDGDIMIVDTSKTNHGDGVYVIAINNNFFVKRLRFTPKRIEVISDNPRYKTQTLDGEWFEYNDIHIVGKSIVAICRT